MENKQLQESISKMIKVHKSMDKFWEDILNDSDVPQELKNQIIENREKLNKDREEYKKFLEENKHRKVVGYNPDTFEPIYGEPQTQMLEISDEEMEKGALSWFMTANKREIIFDLGWMEIFKAGIKWYREQLKKK